MYAKLPEEKRQAVALRLFDLVNAIADQMISHPKKVQEMYAKLPEEKRKAVEARDAAPKKHI